MPGTCSFWLVAACGWLLVATGAAAAGPAIRAVAGADGRPTAIEAVGLSNSQLAELARLADDDPRWAQTLAVYVGQAPEDVPPLSGRYEVAGEAVRFTPRYALLPGLTYRAELTLLGEDSSSSAVRHFTKTITTPALPPGEPARVTAVYPSASVLPENQLRFYLHFSAPMRQGEAYSHIKLLGPGGQPDKRAFLEIGEELWDASGTRLTLLFDPGRTKQGLLPREEFGPVLLAGNEYRLVIDPAWRDANGRPLAAGYEKRFKAGPMVEAVIDAQRWAITPPRAGARESLVVRFDRPLDHALVLRMIGVEGPDKNPIAGDVNVSDEERRWAFRPDAVWAAGGHWLVVDTALEDSAGNNLARPFEVDVFETIDKQPASELVRIPFSVR